MFQGVIGFALGILLLQFQPSLPPWYLTLSLPSLLWLAWRFPSFRIFAAVAFGFLWASWSAQGQLPSGIVKELDGVEITIEGVVDSLPEVDGRRLRFEYMVDSINGVSGGDDLPLRVRLSWYRNYPKLRVGERWRLKIKLRRPHGFSNPGGFDYEGWLYRRGINATGYVRGGEVNSKLGEGGIEYTVDRWRERLREQVISHLGQTHGSGLLLALTIGDRSGFGSAEWQLFSRTGTNHLVAISGLHIGIIAGLLFFLGKRLWALSLFCLKLMPASQAAAILAFSGALFYAAMAGFSIPTQRALVMLAVVTGAVLLRRPLPGSRTLLYALAAVLAVDPSAVLSAGFWFSYAAVGAIMFVLAGRAGRPGYLTGALKVQWSVSVILAPFLFTWGMGVSLVAPLINLVAVPVFSFLLVPLSLVAVVLTDLFNPAGIILLDLAELLLGEFHRLLNSIGSSSWLLYKPAVVPTALWLLSLAGVVLIMAPMGFPGKAPGAVLFMIPFFWSSVPLKPGEARFTLLDVGQGMSVVVETRHHLLVYDTGPKFSERFNAGSAVLLPYLHQRGIKAIDRMVLSNGDQDHLGGFSAVAAQLPIRSVLSGEPIDTQDVTQELCQEGMEWHWDGVNFRVLHPDRKREWRGNDTSCVLMVEAAGHRLLLTGDIEQSAEQSLMESQEGELSADLVTIPHHGSLTSSGEAFIEAVSPGYALASAGYRNRYGFPRPEVVARWRAAGAEVVQTADSGAVIFLLGQQGGIGEPTLYRRENRRYWHGVP